MVHPAIIGVPKNQETTRLVNSIDYFNLLPNKSLMNRNGYLLFLYACVKKKIKYFSNKYFFHFFPSHRNSKSTIFKEMFQTAKSLLILFFYW
jgi:hypothetical protein